MNFIIKIIM